LSSRNTANTTGCHYFKLQVNLYHHLKCSFYCSSVIILFVVAFEKIDKNVRHKVNAFTASTLLVGY